VSDMTKILKWVFFINLLINAKVSKHLYLGILTSYLLMLHYSTHCTVRYNTFLNWVVGKTSPKLSFHHLLRYLLSACFIICAVTYNVLKHFTGRLPTSKHLQNGHSARRDAIHGRYGENLPKTTFVCKDRITTLDV
jgi:hypothetical protein